MQAGPKTGIQWEAYHELPLHKINQRAIMKSLTQILTAITNTSFYSALFHFTKLPRKRFLYYADIMHAFVIN